MLGFLLQRTYYLVESFYKSIPKEKEKELVFYNIVVMSVIKRNDAISQKHLDGRSQTLQVSKCSCYNGTKNILEYSRHTFFGQTQNIHISIFF